MCLYRFVEHLRDKTINSDGNSKHNVRTMFFVENFILIKDLMQVLRIYNCYIFFKILT